jgi:hypothetical protein
LDQRGIRLRENGENCITWSFAKYNKNNQVEEDEMGGACSTNGGEEEGVQVIGGKARGKETATKTKM